MTRLGPRPLATTWPVGRRSSPGLEAGWLVLRGLRANALYILTHPEYEEILQAPYEALLAAMPRDVPLTERRLAMARSFCQTSSYARERDRKRWAREGAHRSA